MDKAAREFIMNDKLSIVLVGDKNLLMQKLGELPIEIVEVDLFGEKI